MLTHVTSHTLPKRQEISFSLFDEPSEMTRALVNSATYLALERNLVPPLHDTGTECDQISYRTNFAYCYENRSELVPAVSLVPVDHFVPLSCRPMKVGTGMNSYRYYVNTPPLARRSVSVHCPRLGFCACEKHMKSGLTCQGERDERKSKHNFQALEWNWKYKFRTRI